MRVCQFSILPPSEVGGVESVVRNLTIHLNKLGIKTKSVYGQEGYEGHLRSILSTGKIVKYRNKFDIINTHGYSGFGLSVIPKRFRKAKHIVTFHGTWINYFNALGCEGVKNKLLRKVSVWVEKKAMRDYDYGIAVSNWVKESVVKQYGVGENKVVVIHNGVDCGRFRPMKLTKQYDMIWVGTNPILKGLKEAIKVANNLDIKLIVVGVEGNNSSNVKYLGKINFKDMPRIYNMSKLLLLPSKYESFPSVAMEALASGLPVIVSPESHCEILNDKCGIITNNYKEAVKELLSKDLVSISKHCRRLAEKYDWSIQAKKYIKIYRRLVPI